MQRLVITVLPHPPNSPDLALCDFFVFNTLKRKLSGRLRIRNREEVLATVKPVLRHNIPHNNIVCHKYAKVDRKVAEVCGSEWWLYVIDCMLLGIIEFGNLLKFVFGYFLIALLFSFSIYKIIDYKRSV